MPLDWTVEIRMLAADVVQAAIPAQHVSGDLAQSLWRAEATIPKGVSVLQVMATGP